MVLLHKFGFKKWWQNWYDEFICSIKWMCCFRLLILPYDSTRKNKPGLSAKKKEHHITITKIVRWLRRRINRNSVIQVSHQNDWPKMKYAQWMIWRFMKYSIYQPKISDMECQQMKTGSNGMSLMPDTITEPKDGDMTDKTSDIGNYCVRSIHILYIYNYIYNYITLYIYN